jgi:hypothetical protein
MNNQRPATKILVLAVIAAIVILILGYAVGTRRPFEGKYNNVALTEIKGDLLQVKSFQTVSGFKFVWLVKVNEYKPMEGTTKSFLPELLSEDTFAVDVTDSRANLYIDSTPTTCYPIDQNSLPRVCEYKITQTKAVLIVGEEVGSSGLPETSGTPR